MKNPEHQNPNNFTIVDFNSDVPGSKTWFHRLNSDVNSEPGFKDLVGQIMASVF